MLDPSGAVRDALNRLAGRPIEDEKASQRP